MESMDCDMFSGGKADFSIATEVVDLYRGETDSIEHYSPYPFALYNTCFVKISRAKFLGLNGALSNHIGTKHVVSLDLETGEWDPTEYPDTTNTIGIPYCALINGICDQHCRFDSYLVNYIKYR